MRPTSLGRELGVATAGFIVLALALDWPELMVPGALGVVALLTAVAGVTRRPAALIADDRQQVVDPPATPVVRLRLHPRRRRTSVQVAVTVDDAPIVSEHVVIAARRRAVEVPVELPDLGRGLHSLGPVTARTADPLQLVHRERIIGGPSAVLVHPRREPALAVPAALDRHRDGPVPQLTPLGGEAEDGVRAYEEGDDLRLLHAPATRRHGTLMLRRRVLARSSGATVVLDTAAAAYAAADDFEAAVSVAASIACATAHGDRPVVARTVGGRVLERGVGAAGQAAVLGALAYVELDGADPGLAQPAALLARGDDHPYVVVTGDLDAAAMHALTVLARRRPLVGVVAVTRSPVPRVLGDRVRAAPDAATAVRAWNHLVGPQGSDR